MRVGAVGAAFESEDVALSEPERSTPLAPTAYLKGERKDKESL